MHDFDHKKQETADLMSLGSTVMIKGSNLSGIIVKIEKNGVKTHVEVNGKILKLDKDKLALKKPPKQKKKKNTSKSVTATNGDESISIDLHGMTRVQAYECLTAFLDKALLKNVHKLEIIHGHGNGIIKKEVQRFLEESAHVADYKVLEHNTGTTCAYLK